ncbi:type II toxin-antitoxin system VapC family toxin [Sphingomonas sp. HITSZ_GF]|uniref:type II toxin-antitoxin system VapC family toxin n=1 Tax=Sphingomonas sp. HITSZ_GF TaxID=3037247 RepID=UPI00240D4C66|nr:type II toxin-antitoxin system VapC family toxin [Sphingomonas sp. HITSZ_GF]MDG2535614.1 type II toxin-antitoxin system VapC family toxin [Sphingomonas sp. HITSZ_GF]
MILVDTSIWADHFRAADSSLSALLERGMVLLHPFVLGELALGNLADWDGTVGALGRLPRPVLAGSEDVLSLIKRESLMGTGLGWVDATLLASARLTPDSRLWTRDVRLAAAAQRLGIGLPEH